MAPSSALKAEFHLQSVKDIERGAPMRRDPDAPER